MRSEIGVSRSGKKGNEADKALNRADSAVEIEERSEGFGKRSKEVERRLGFET